MELNNGWREGVSPRGWSPGGGVSRTCGMSLLRLLYIAIYLASDLIFFFCFWR